MYNWSTDTTELKKNPAKYTKWKLEQLINFGLNGEKIKKNELKEHFDELDIDPVKKSYLKFLIQSSYN